jgi:hypothetical protein
MLRYPSRTCPLKCGPCAAHHARLYYCPPSGFKCCAACPAAVSCVGHRGAAQSPRSSPWCCAACWAVLSGGACLVLLVACSARWWQGADVGHRKLWQSGAVTASEQGREGWRPCLTKTRTTDTGCVPCVTPINVAQPSSSPCSMPQLVCCGLPCSQMCDCVCTCFNALYNQVPQHASALVQYGCVTIKIAPACAPSLSMSVWAAAVAVLPLSASALFNERPTEQWDARTWKQCVGVVLRAAQHCAYAAPRLCSVRH